MAPFLTNNISHPYYVTGVINSYVPEVYALYINNIKSNAILSYFTLWPRLKSFTKILWEPRYGNILCDLLVVN